VADDPDLGFRFWLLVSGWWFLVAEIGQHARCARDHALPSSIRYTGEAGLAVPDLPTRIPFSGAVRSANNVQREPS
jgi:hypothetical protein